MRSISIRTWGGLRLGLVLAWGLVAAASAGQQNQEAAGVGGPARDIWMGVYINGIKVGHSHTRAAARTG